MTVCLVFGLRSWNIAKAKVPNPKTILLSFAQNDKFGFHGLNRDITRYFLSYAPESHGLRRLRMTDYDGNTLVAAFPDFHAKGNRAQQWHVIHLGQACAAAFAENVVARAGVRRDEVTHVLNNSQYRDSDRLKHAQRPPHVRDGHVLRSR